MKETLLFTDEETKAAGAPRSREPAPKSGRRGAGTGPLDSSIWVQSGRQHSHFGRRVAEPQEKGLGFQTNTRLETCLLKKTNPLMTNLYEPK